MEKPFDFIEWPKPLLERRMEYLCINQVNDDYTPQSPEAVARELEHICFELDCRSIIAGEVEVDGMMSEEIRSAPVRFYNLLRSMREGNS